MSAKLPVTVITGFLGAGKTTLIRHLLQNNQGRRIAVLVNEFGEVGIDGELLRSCQVCDDEPSSLNQNIVELANGCLCCTVQEEFLPTMQALLDRRDQIDCIAIETSGLALPKPLVKAFRWPEIRTGATVDGVVTVVDCVAISQDQLVGDLAALEAQRAADDSLDHETPIEELFADQISCADLILLTKADCVTAAERDRVMDWLKDRAPQGVKIVPCERGEIAPEILLGFNAAVEDDLDNRPSHHDAHHHHDHHHDHHAHDHHDHAHDDHTHDHDHDHPHDDHAHDHHDHDHHDHDHDEGIVSVSVKLDRAFEPQALVQQLQAIVNDREIYRIKGFVNVPGKAMRSVVQGVGRRFDHFYDRPWRSDEPRQTQLVFIGRDLDAAELTASLTPHE